MDVRSTSLDEWLQLLRAPPTGVVFAANHFPSERHRQDFFQRLPSFDDETIRVVLRHFLPGTGSNLMDGVSAESIYLQLKAGTLQPSKMFEHQRRLLRHYLTGFDYPVWEGVHWVLDLLPYRPRQALDALDAFFFIGCQFLTDAYLLGFGYAKTIIRHRYIHSPGTEIDAKTTLASLHWREVEWLAGVLYQEMDYQVKVTSRSDDDGIDALATGSRRGEPHRIVVQAKKWSKKRVEKADVRELVGAMDEARATSGVLIATGGFTSGARKMELKDRRVELIDGAEFVRLLNENCGTDWYLKVDALISRLKHSTGGKS